MGHMNDMASKTLDRKREGRLVAGVCVGLADYFGFPVAAVRVVFVVAALPFFAFLGALVYLVSWAVVPDEGEKESIVERLVNKGKSR
jgi:phage shock protein PspC (stress-responsive transcriptional regulator)